MPGGDSFWDLVRKGAETAAKKDNIELRYSNDPEAPNQANLVQSAIDSGVDGIAVTLAKPDAMRAAVDAAAAKGIPVVAFNAGMDSWMEMGVKEYFGRTASSPARGSATGSALKVRPRRCVSSKSRGGTWTSKPAAPASGIPFRPPRS